MKDLPLSPEEAGLILELLSEDIPTNWCNTQLNDGLEKRIRELFSIPEEAIVHGVNCQKSIHDRMMTGYLHSENDDRPYDVDGVKYCGRCHFVL